MGIPQTRLGKAGPPETVPEPGTLPEPVLHPLTIEELRRHYGDLSKLYNAGALLSATLEWEPLLKRILDAATRLVHANGASLKVFEDSGSGRGVEPGPDPQAAGEVPEQVDCSAAEWAAHHREAVLLAGPAELQRFPATFPEPRLISSAMCIPLIPPPASGQVQEVLGVLSLQREAANAAFTRDELELASAFSTQAAAALANARLYKQMQRRHTQLQNLIEISRSLTASLDLDNVLQLIMEKAVELLACEAGSLLLVDQETRELVFKIALGPAGAKLIESRLPPGAGIAGAAARDGRPLIINDAKADSRHYAEVDASTDLTTRSLLCVPLISKERVIGVVEVMNKLDGTPFTEEDRESLSAFATESAIALENAQLYSDLKRAFTDTVRVIANAVEARDPYTSGHIARVTRVALEIARELGWSAEKMELVEIGALLHDIGKIGVTDAILRKPGQLTREEYALMKEHPLVGARMLEGVAVLRPILPYVLYHQERYDGGGYPFGLSGKEIPIEGRLLAVVDTFDAITSDRPYRTGLSVEEAIQEIARNRGTQFDPDVVDALLRVASKGRLATPKPRRATPA